MKECFIYDSNENYIVTAYLDGYEPFLNGMQIQKYTDALLTQN